MQANSAKRLDFHAVLEKRMARYGLQRDVLEQLVADFDDNELVKIAFMHFMPKPAVENSEFGINLAAYLLSGYHHYYASTLALVRRHNALNPPDDRLFALVMVITLGIEGLKKRTRLVN